MPHQQHHGSSSLTPKRDNPLGFDTLALEWLEIKKASGIREKTYLALEDHIEKAIALYRGGFLEGFSVSDSAPFEDWARLERERLGRQAAEVLGKLAGHWEERGDLERALGFATVQFP